MPGAGDVVGREGGEGAGEDGVLVDEADGENFDSKDCSGKRSTEYGAETCGDSSHKEDAAISVANREFGEETGNDACAGEPGDLIREGCSGLDGCAFAAGGASEKVG